jgi:hypothetical protein
MLDLTKLSLNQKHIVSVYLEASKLELRQGKDWYTTAHDVCQELADTYNKSFKLVCIIMSVLSPATSWENNVKYCEKFLEDYTTDSVSIEDNMYTTYKFNAQKALDFINDPTKAFAWFEAEVSELGSGHKTWSFAHNIYGETEYATIDRHAYRVWKHGLGLVEMKTPSLSRKQYISVWSDYSVVANLLGLEVSTLQAVTWIVIRNKLHPTTDK